MSEAIDDTVAADGDKTAPLPHSWVNLGFGFAAVCIFAISTGVIVQGFLSSRPRDLRDVSLRTFHQVEKFFLSHHIGTDSILKSEPDLQQDLNAAFYYATYDVELPATISPEGMKLLLERRLRSLQIQVTDWIDNDASKGLHLNYGEYRLARLSFTSALYRTDERSNRAPIEPTPRSVPAPDTAIASRASWTPNDLEPRVQLDGALIDTALGSTPRQSQTTAARPRMAIIVDDGGYGGSATRTILDLDNRLTLSILPNTPGGRSLAEKAAELGFEVMLHMPMENTNPKMRHEGELEVGMSPEQVAGLVQAALAQVPGAVGINNHTGSKYTQDTDAMGHFLDSLKDSGLYFVDSRTTPNAKGYELASARRIPTAKRHLFLDHDNEPGAIRARFKEAMHLAEQNGRAVVICHFRRNTAAVLAELLPDLERRGIELVPASVLVQ